MPTGHFGYPQPENSWEASTYDATACPRCGIAPIQRYPFRLRGEPGARKSDFLQLNWVFGVFFVRPHVAADLAAMRITGAVAGPVLHHKSGQPLETLVQLHIESPLPAGAVAVGALQPVTCRPENEESHAVLPGPKRYPPETPFCGRRKYHMPPTLRVRADALAEASELAHTAEWFGSGGIAFRPVVASERIVALAQSRKWRGVRWQALDLIP